jgi:hypothetical protein
VAREALSSLSTHGRESWPGKYGDNMIWIAFWVLVSFVLALSFGLSAAWREIDALHKDLGNAKDELINVANIMTVLEATIAKKEDRWYQ